MCSILTILQRWVSGTPLRLAELSYRTVCRNRVGVFRGMTQLEVHEKKTEAGSVSWDEAQDTIVVKKSGEVRHAH